MGITGFAKFIEETFPEAIHDTTLRDLKIGGRVAVDGLNESYVQMHVARTEIIAKTSLDKVMEISNGGVERRIEMYRDIRKYWISRVLDFIYTDLKGKVVWVIDGENVPRLKEETRKLRREKMDKAKTDFHTSLEELKNKEFPNPHEYRKILHNYVTSKPPSTEDFQTLYAVLVSLDIPLVKAWGEGEKTCSRLCDPLLVEENLRERYLCEAVWSADTDSILFGAPLLIQRKKRGLDKVTGQLRVYNPSATGLSRESLVKICIANGCDYCTKGIPGLGMKKAYKKFGGEENVDLPEELREIAILFNHKPEELIRPIVENPRVFDKEIVNWFTMIYG